MAEITDFISTASRDLGEPEHTTRAATGVLLDVIRQHASSSDVQTLLNAIPGASSLSGPVVQRSRSSGGLLGGVLKSAASRFGLGSSVGTTIDVLGQFHSTGFSTHSVGRLASMFMGFVRANTNDDLAQRLMRDVPHLGGL